MAEKVKTVFECYFLLPDFKSREHPTLNGTILLSFNLIMNRYRSSFLSSVLFKVPVLTQFCFQKIDIRKYTERETIDEIFLILSKMLFIISSTLAVIGISTFAWYSLTWKKDFSQRYSKLNPKCISNSLLKYRRKGFIPNKSLSVQFSESPRYGRSNFAELRTVRFAK